MEIGSYLILLMSGIVMMQSPTETPTPSPYPTNTPYRITSTYSLPCPEMPAGTPAGAYGSTFQMYCSHCVSTPTPRATNQLVRQTEYPYGWTYLELTQSPTPTPTLNTSPIRTFYAITVTDRDDSYAVGWQDWDAYYNGLCQDEADTLGYTDSRARAIAVGVNGGSDSTLRINVGGADRVVYPWSARYDIVVRTYGITNEIFTQYFPTVSLATGVEWNVDDPNAHEYLTLNVQNTTGNHRKKDWFNGLSASYLLCDAISGYPQTPTPVNDTCFNPTILEPIVSVDGEFSIASGDCYTVISEIDITLPEIEGLFAGFQWQQPEIALCVEEVQTPSMSLLGINLSLDYIGMLMLVGIIISMIRTL